MAYPDNVFEQDQLEVDQYGGANPGAMDQNAWTWITGLVRSISKVVLASVRVWWANATAIVQEGVVPGDVLAHDLSQDATDPSTGLKIPYVAKFSTITGASGIPKIIGVCVTTTAAQSRAQYAAGGLLQQQNTGLTSQTGGGQVGVDPATSRMRAFQAGDEFMGYTSPNGAVTLAFAGRSI